MHERWIRGSVLALLLLGHAPASATSCMIGAPGSSDAIFLARVDETGTKEIPPRRRPDGSEEAWPTYRRVLRVTVGDVWTDALPDQVTLEVSRWSYLSPKPGETWLFRADQGPDGLQVGDCGGSTPHVEDAVRELPPPPLRRVIPPWEPSALEAAVAAGDPAAVTQAIAAGGDPDAAVPGGTLLGRAVEACDVPVVQALLERGTFQWAVAEGALKCPEPARDALLTIAASRTQTKHLRNPLQWGPMGVVEALLSHGMPLDRAALAAAAGSPRPQVRALVSRAPIDAADASWILGHAQSLPDVEIVRLLLDAGGDPNGVPDGKPPLAAAVRAECIPCIELLLARGARVDGRYDSEGPLYRATQSGREDLVRLLLARGADPLAGPEPSSVLALAAGKQLLDVFLERPVPPDVLGPVLRAAALDTEAARRLLALGADPTAAIEPLARHGDLDLLRELLALGADPDGEPGQGRPLASAASALRLEAVEVLLAAGAEVDGGAAKGHRRTPLMAAAERYIHTPEHRALQEEIVARLLGAGADPGRRLPDGRSAADLAEATNNPELAHALRQLRPDDSRPERRRRRPDATP